MRKTVVSALIVIAFLYALLLSATPVFAQSSGQERQQPRQPLGSSTPSAERIAREVRHELLLLPYYTLFDNLAFKVDGNKVTLLGQVTNPTLKRDAEKAIKSVEGVESIDNQIEVLPPSPNDDRIRRREYRAIYGFDGLTRYAMGALPSIHIIVKNGHVTLTGVVDSEGDKNMAGIQANSVPGVFSVTNNLVAAKPGSGK
jgi:hyperosmotically inducible protein